MPALLWQPDRSLPGNTENSHDQSCQWRSCATSLAIARGTCQAANRLNNDDVAGKSNSGISFGKLMFPILFECSLREHSNTTVYRAKALFYYLKSGRNNYQSSVR